MYTRSIPGIAQPAIQNSRILRCGYHKDSMSFWKQNVQITWGIVTGILELVSYFKIKILSATAFPRDGVCMRLNIKHRRPRPLYLPLFKQSRLWPWPEPARRLMASWRPAPARAPSPPLTLPEPQPILSKNLWKINDLRSGASWNVTSAFWHLPRPLKKRPRRPPKTAQHASKMPQASEYRARMNQDSNEHRSQNRSYDKSA